MQIKTQETVSFVVIIFILGSTSIAGTLATPMTPTTNINQNFAFPVGVSATCTNLRLFCQLTVLPQQLTY